MGRSPESRSLNRSMSTSNVHWPLWWVYLASHPRCARRRRRRLGLSLVVLLDPLCQVFCQRDVPCSLVTSPGFKDITRDRVVEPRAKPFDCLPESSPAGLVAGSNSSKRGGKPLRFRGDRRVLGVAGPAEEVFK